MHGLGLASVLSLMLRIKGRAFSEVGTSTASLNTMDLACFGCLFEPTFFGSLVDVQ